MHVKNCGDVSRCFDKIAFAIRFARKLTRRGRKKRKERDRKRERGCINSIPIVLLAVCIESGRGKISLARNKLEEQSFPHGYPPRTSDESDRKPSEGRNKIDSHDRALKGPRRTFYSRSVHGWNVSIRTI